MRNSTQTDPMPEQKAEAVPSQSGQITLKQLVEKAHFNNRNLHDILGGGTAADVLLWRDTVSSLTLVFVATELWFVFSSVKLYTFAQVLIAFDIFLLCQCLVTFLVVLFYLPGIYKYLHHQIESTVDVFTRDLIAFKLGDKNGWYPFGTVNKLVNAVSPVFDPDVDEFGKSLTKLNNWNFNNLAAGLILSPPRNALVQVLQNTNDRNKEILNYWCKIANLLYQVKDAIFHSGEDQTERLKDVVISIIKAATVWGEKLVFGMELGTGIGKETAQMLIMISSHPDSKTLDGKDKQYPIKWAIAYLEWLAISIFFYGPATVIYMGYICIATVPAILNYWMGCDSGSRVAKSQG